MLTGSRHLAPQTLWRYYTELDETRRQRGRVLDRLGWGPRPLPSRPILHSSGVALRGYPALAGKPQTSELPVVLVPAPIKQAYIWDLAPGSSVVRCCLTAGLRPYLVHWDPPEQDRGLADYVVLLRDCVDAALRESGERQVFIAGHSLGGLFAAAFACRYPASVAGLIVLGAPLHFDYQSTTGALGPLIAGTEGSPMLAETAGNLPGSLLSTASFIASPTSFGTERFMDWLRSLADPAAIVTHRRVMRWTLDEMPLARRLVEDILLLYRDNALLTGQLEIDGKRAAPGDMAAPLLLVGDRRCAVAPPASMLPFLDAVASSDKQMLWYEGDVGVALQHVGMLVGRNAMLQLWPAILAWLAARGAQRGRNTSRVS